MGKRSEPWGVFTTGASWSRSSTEDRQCIVILNNCSSTFAKVVGSHCGRGTFWIGDTNGWMELFAMYNRVNDDEEDDINCCK